MMQMPVLVSSLLKVDGGITCLLLFLQLRVSLSLYAGFTCMWNQMHRKFTWDCFTLHYYNLDLYAKFYMFESLSACHQFRMSDLVMP